MDLIECHCHAWSIASFAAKRCSCYAVPGLLSGSSAGISKDGVFAGKPVYFRINGISERALLRQDSLRRWALWCSPSKSSGISCYSGAYTLPNYLQRSCRYETLKPREGTWRYLLPSWLLFDVTGYPHHAGGLDNALTVLVELTEGLAAYVSERKPVPALLCQSQQYRGVRQVPQWRQNPSWQQISQVEQYLIICRALVELYSHHVATANLVFLGGRAAFQRHLSAARQDLNRKLKGPATGRMSERELGFNVWIMSERSPGKSGLTCNHFFYNQGLPFYGLTSLGL